MVVIGRSQSKTPDDLPGAVFWLWLLLCRLTLARLFHLYFGHIAKPERG